MNQNELTYVSNHPNQKDKKPKKMFIHGLSNDLVDPKIE